MGVREGGSYAADPKTGEAKRAGGTVQEDAHRVEAVEPVEVTSAPASPPAEPEPAAPPRRRGAPDTKPQE